MKYNNLGKTGLKVSELCLGTHGYGGPDELWFNESGCGPAVVDETAIEIIRRAIDLGVNFIDTGDVYSMGRAEIVVGKAIEGRRDEIVLATKVGDPSEASRFGKEVSGPNEQGLSRKHIMKSVNDSLKRLGTDYIDLYQIHHADPSTPWKETLQALTDLVRQGKVHYIGCCNLKIITLYKALSTSDLYDLDRFVSLQSRYNFRVQRVGEEQSEALDVFSFLANEEIGFVPVGIASVDMHTRPRDTMVLEALKNIATEEEKTINQLTLAWMRTIPAVTSLFISPHSIRELEENVEAMDWKLPQTPFKRVAKITNIDIEKLMKLHPNLAQSKKSTTLQ